MILDDWVWILLDINRSSFFLWNFDPTYFDDYSDSLGAFVLWNDGECFLVVCAWPLRNMYTTVVSRPLVRRWFDPTPLLRVRPAKKRRHSETSNFCRGLLTARRGFHCRDSGAIVDLLSRSFWQQIDWLVGRWFRGWIIVEDDDDSFFFLVFFGGFIFFGGGGFPLLARSIDKINNLYLFWFWLLLS